MSEPIRPLNLYEITTELRQLEEALIESGGVIDEETEERFSELLEMEADKIEGYLAMIRKFEASEEAIKQERQRLQKAEQSMKNAAQSLKDRLAEAMRRRGEEVHETKLGKVRLQEAPRRSVVVDAEEEELPERFRRVRVTPDKRAIRKALEAGDEEAAALAHFDEPSYYVRIY